MLTGFGATLLLSACGDTAAKNSFAVVAGSSTPDTTTDPDKTAQSQAAATYTWPAYSPTLNYSYGYTLTTRPNLTLRNDRGGVARNTINGYVAFREGPTPNPILTNPMTLLELTRLNADLKIAIETMGFAPDKGFARGYYLNYYLLGSGLTGDTASSDTEVGYQGWDYYNGEYWPSTNTSYHAILKAYNGDYTNRSNITHETIHVLQSGTGSFTNAGWFHEAHNTHFGAWLIGLRDGTKTLGWLDAVGVLGPHIPIECFGGWLTDGTFGDPAPGRSAGLERPFFGGFQYGGTFPLFLRLWVAPTITNWLWKNNTPASETVLQTLQKGLGVAQMQRLIEEYRARMALLDFKDWRSTLRDQVNGSFDANTYMYAVTTQNGRTLTPASDTLPGLSGANYIPLTVSGSTASVTFTPTGANMRCQLVYLATDGTAQYGTPVSSGNCTISLTKPALNGAVIAVITNVDIAGSRSTKYGYTLTMGTGLGKAPTNVKYF